MTKKYKLIQTCGACPESYDVYLHDNLVGSLRLRHGRFTAQVSGKYESVYCGYPSGDGIFKYEERGQYINEAIDAIDKALYSGDIEWYIE